MSDEQRDVADSGVAAEELKRFVERIERMEEERQVIVDDVKDIYAELKGRGFDTKAVRRVVALRRLDRAERQEMDAIIELYLSALDMT